MISIYYTSDEWDGLVIYETLDEKVALADLLAIILPGHLAETQLFLLYSMKDMMKVLKTAKALEFRGIERELPPQTPT